MSEDGPERGIRRRRRPAVVSACGGLVVSAALAWGSPVLAQGPSVSPAGPRAGVFAGVNTTEQEWSPAAEAEAATGFMVGAFLDVATPLPAFSILAEGSYTQRGGDVVDAGTAAVEGAVRTDYLSVSLRPKLTASIGPARLYAAAGPVFENVLRSRVSTGFETILEREGRSVFGVLAGAGVDVSLGGGRTVGVEARRFEGLGDAYDGDFLSVRNRSWEAVVRFGIPLRR